MLRERFVSGNGDGRIRLHQEMLSGAGAGFFQVAATNPMEIVKLRMQLQGEAGAGARRSCVGAGRSGRRPPRPSAATTCLQPHSLLQRVAVTLTRPPPPSTPLSAWATISEMGVRGLYRGTAATWLRDVPFSIVFFPLFANLKAAFNGNDSMVGLFAAGAISGSLSAGSVTPCDVIKTRLQVKGSPYTSIGHAATTILREEGPQAFFKGLAPRMVVQAPLFGITLFAFDVLKRWYAAQVA